MSDDSLGVGLREVCARLSVSEVEGEGAWWSTFAEACFLQIILVVAFLRLNLQLMIYWQHL